MSFSQMSSEAQHAPGWCQQVAVLVSCAGQYALLYTAQISLAVVILMQRSCTMNLERDQLRFICTSCAMQVVCMVMPGASAHCSAAGPGDPTRRRN